MHRHSLYRQINAMFLGQPKFTWSKYLLSLKNKSLQWITSLSLPKRTLAGAVTLAVAVLVIIFWQKTSLGQTAPEITEASETPLVEFKPENISPLLLSVEQIQSSASATTYLEDIWDREYSLADQDRYAGDSVYQDFIIHISDNLQKRIVSWNSKAEIAGIVMREPLEREENLGYPNVTIVCKPHQQPQLTKITAWSSDSLGLFATEDLSLFWKTVNNFCSF